MELIWNVEILQLVSPGVSEKVGAFPGYSQALVHTKSIARSDFALHAFYTESILCPLPTPRFRAFFYRSIWSSHLRGVAERAEAKTIQSITHFADAVDCGMKFGINPTLALQKSFIPQN